MVHRTELHLNNLAGSEGFAFVLYDSDCGHCSSFLKAVKLLDVREVLIPVPLKSDMAFRLVKDTMPKQQMLNSFHLVTRSHGFSKVYSGGDGIIQLLVYFPLVSAATILFRRYESLRLLANRAYLQITRIRHSSTCIASQSGAANHTATGPA